MIIQKVRFKNVLAFGNYWSEIQLDANDLTIVTGDNGAGKSSMLLDTICFGLYGRLFRDVVQKAYINSITKKELVVEVFFSIGRDEYKIVRGMKPTLFEIYLNGALLPQNSDKRGYQSYLEDNILRCGFKTFTQIVVLGSTAYKPFLNLDAAERRSVVDNILDLEVVGWMNAMQKKDFAALTETIRGEENRKNIITEKIKIYNDNALNAQKRIDDQIDYFELSSIRNIDDIVKFEEELKCIQIDSIDHTEMINKILAFNTKQDRIASGCSKSVRDLEKEIKFYEHTEVCEVCGQDIDINFREQRLVGLRSQLKIDKENYIKATGLLSEGEIKLSEFRNKQSLNERAAREKSKIETAIKMTKETLTKSQVKIKELKQTHYVADEQTLIDLNADLMELNKNLNNLYNERNIQQIILKILKDDGGKAQVVHQYIDDLNGYINKFLIDMDFFVEFYLDENFNETIKSRYRDEFSYNSFSDGQKLRINLAILFAWRELAKRRNSVSINLLVFDEVLSGSLDSKGVSDFIDILKKLHVNTNIFLITHSTNGMSRVDETINVSMLQGFSRIDQDK